MLSPANFASISDLRDRTSLLLREIDASGKKIILSNNKPIAVMLSITEYNHMKKLSFESEPVSQEDIVAYKKSSHGTDGVEAFTFLDSLRENV